MYEPITDDELRFFCRMAVEKGWTRHHAHMQLRAQGRKISENRLNRTWAACGGKVIPRYMPSR